MAMLDLKKPDKKEATEAMGELKVIQEQPLHRNVLWYRGELVFEAHRLLYHSA